MSRLVKKKSITTVTITRLKLAIYSCATTKNVKSHIWQLGLSLKEYIMNMTVEVVIVKKSK